MNFNDHSDLIGLHAAFSPSKYHWVNYDEEKILSSYTKALATQRGTETHEFAALCIRRRQRLPKSNISLNSYVNDAIGFRMTPEQPLFYSINFFGTADAIKFSENLLRVHDLKTGVSPVSMKQLEIYCGLFCLEYNKLPKNIKMELRIYQSDEILVHIPDPKEIASIMEKIVQFDRSLEKLKSEMES